MNRIWGWQRFFLIVFAVIIAWNIAAFGWLLVDWRDIFMEKETYRSNRLFQPHGEQVYHLAQKIERKQKISLAEVKALPDGVNQRYGDDITLLFHAVAAYNLQAIDVLLEAGSDPTMRTHGTYGYDFIYLMGLPGGDEGTPGDINFVNGLIRLYLKHGGDPNIRTEGNSMQPIIARAATFRNIEGMRLLLEADADFWAVDKRGSYAASILARSYYSHLLHEFIDAGYFDRVPETALKRFMLSLSGYTQRGDDISLQNQKVGRRVLKRNPFYEEDTYTRDLFQGPIPWKQILEESDRY